MPSLSVKIPITLVIPTNVWDPTWPKVTLRQSTQFLGPMSALPSTKLLISIEPVNGRSALTKKVTFINLDGVLTEETHYPIVEYGPSIHMEEVFSMRIGDIKPTKGGLASRSNVDEGSLEAELVAEGIDLQASIVPEDLANPSSELINPTANSLQVFQQHSQWLDKTVY
jgi:hypothetical protein